MTVYAFQADLFSAICYSTVSKLGVCSGTLQRHTASCTVYTHSVVMAYLCLVACPVLVIGNILKQASIPALLMGRLQQQVAGQGMMCHSLLHLSCHSDL